MLPSASRRFVCWRCLRQDRRDVSLGRRLDVKSINSSPKRFINTQSQNHTDESLTSIHNKQTSLHNLPEPDGQPIRQRLRSWLPKTDVVSPGITDWAMSGKLLNNTTRPQSTGTSELDNFKSSPEGMTEVADEASTEDAIIGTGARNAGDLVEINQPGNRTPLFCIFLGYFGDRNHFYSSTGKWIMSLGFSSIFTVSNFATTEELRPLLDMIPKDCSSDTYDDLRAADKGPSREAGDLLIKKMNKFILESDRVYQGSLTNLDRARSLISDGQKTKYLSLFEIADTLLPQSLRTGDGFPPHALYAVHKALYRNDFAFRPVSPLADCHRRDHLFEVFPYQVTLMINRVSALVREYTLVSGQQVKPFSPEDLKGSALGNFILKARQYVQASRERRPWTPYGIITPSSETSFQTPIEWSNSSKDIIRYLEWWASYDLFEEASRFHSYGSLILRALDLYPDAILDQSTAWTFLQEIGAIPPWEIPSRYKVRFPDVQIQSGGGLIREPPVKIEDSRRPDIADGARKQWNNTNVFCIDAPSTMLIDDGVSLERTDESDKFWIHIHTADPASGILPNSQLSKFMELVPENIYLPGHFQAMLPSDLGAENTNDYRSESLVDTYSLAPGRKALTFSAKVNESGELLDYKVEPGVLDRVLYLDPLDISSFCKEPSPPPPPEENLTVGENARPDTPLPGRTMIAAQDLSESAKEDMRLLYKLAEAIKQRRLAKGAWPYFFPRPSVTVAFQDTSVQKAQLPPGVKVLPPDPYIKINYESSNGCSVVSNTMVLAGEIAARWCSDRGIPLPYRKDANAETNLSQALEYANGTLYPLIKQGIQPSVAQRQELIRLTGGVELSPTPGPYFMLGLDMYAKATSPLRRFSDLIVHWQIHAALALERQLQRPIDPLQDNLDEALPFTASSLPKTLSLLHMREKMARMVSHGIKDWILIALVRAWRFENSAPRSMRFTVHSRWRQGLMGRLDLFDLDAAMDIDGINETALVRDVHVGDQFDVELADINVHSRQILVKALRYRGGRSESPVGA